jgi:Lon protease-like protein
MVGEEPRDASRLYRIARVVRLADSYPEADRARVARLRAAIATDIAVLVRRAQPDRAHAFDPELFAGVEDEVFVNAVANAFAFPAEEKQALLEADAIPERYARLASALSFQRLELEGSQGGRRHLH